MKLISPRNFIIRVHDSSMITVIIFSKWLPRVIQDCAGHRTDQSRYTVVVIATLFVHETLAENKVFHFH